MTKLYFTSDAGDFYFDNIGSVLSRFDVEYPEIGRTSLGKNGMCGVEYLSPEVGEGRITVEGYLLPGRLSVREYRRDLCRIASAGGEFLLHADSLSRIVSVESLKFDSAPGFASGEAEHFTLKLVSADPCFDGAEEIFTGVCTVNGGIYFPITFTGENIMGTLTNRGSVTIVNRGDVARGFIAEFTFPGIASALVLNSDRQEGAFVVTDSITAGDKIILDTRYGRKSVINSDGTSLLNSLDKKCVFFSAYPGETRINWRSVNGDSPAVSLAFVPGYLNV